MVLAIDFDGVLCGGDVRPGRRMGDPIEGAIEAMQALKAKGYTLIIHTVRGERPKHVVDWLTYWHIPFDDVTRIKPNASLFLDDKAYQFCGWDDDGLKSLWEKE